MTSPPPPQQIDIGNICWIWALHCTHFFMRAAQLSQAHIWPHGRNNMPALRSEHTTHSSIYKSKGSVLLRKDIMHTDSIHNQYNITCKFLFFSYKRLIIINKRQIIINRVDSWMEIEYNINMVFIMILLNYYLIVVFLKLDFRICYIWKNCHFLWVAVKSYLHSG